MINHFNIRQMQAYAAFCLLAFCKGIRVRNVFVDELIIHLLSMLTANNLPDWERKGALIALNGRGDAIPVDVVASIPEDYRDTFNSLLECCVEVGIVDMYGANTEQPRKLLDKCIGILQSIGLEAPSLQSLGGLRKGGSAWGEPVSESEFCNLMKEWERSAEPWPYGTLKKTNTQ